VAGHDEEEELLRSVALQNALSIRAARERAERELIEAKQALELKTAQLAHSLARMRATMESTTDGILVVDERRTITDFNERLLQMWRLSREQVHDADQRDVIGLVSGQFADPGRFLSRVKEIHDAPPAETFDLLELADGRVYERFSRIQVIDGRNVGRVWSFRDITERRRAEEALREEGSVLELLNQTGAAIASQLDLQAVVQTVTDAGTKLSNAKFGAFFYNVVNQEGESFLLYTLSGAPRAAFEKFGLPRNTPVFNTTFRGEGVMRSDDITKDPRYGTMAPHHGMPKGHLPVCSYLAVPVISRTGEVIGGLFFGHPEPAMFSERSERIIVGIAAQAAVAIDNARLYEAAQKAAEERSALLESERAARAEAERMGAMKDDFLATLSHELRTPLGAILGWAQVLRHRPMPQPELHQALDVIERNARAQTQLIEDLLDMSRITSGKVRLDIQPVDPAPVETSSPLDDWGSARPATSIV
jgi:PAS domain S-box-containing protein